MKIRNQQIEAMQIPSQAVRRQLRDALQAQGQNAELDPQTGDLLIRKDYRGTNRLTFDQQGNPRALQTPDGRVHRFDYDKSNLRASLIDSAGNTTRYDYNESLSIAAVTDPAGVRHEVTYDQQRPTAIRRVGGPAIRLGYNEAGALSTLTDGRGGSTYLEYDKGGLLLRSIDRTGGAYWSDYGPQGQLVAVTTPSNATWRVELDFAKGRKTLLYPDGKADTFEQIGESAFRIDRRDGRQVTVRFGPGQRVMEADYPGHLKAQLAYDAEGRLTEARNGTHQAVFEYDDQGRPTAEETDGRRVVARYTGAGLLAEFVTHRKESVSFRYGSDQRIDRVTDWDGRHYVLQRDARGGVITVEFPNQVRWSRQLTPTGTLQADELQLRGRRIVRNYRYDANDLLTDLTDSEVGTKKHRFDAEDRLTAVSSPQLEVSYTYDAHGNAIRMGERVFGYNILDQITVGTGVHCGYDDNGNLTEWSEGGQTTRFRYNGQNQLVSAELPDYRVVKYEYDALGRRLVKRVGDVTTLYTWQSEQLVAEDVEGSEPLRVDYLYLPGTHLPLAMRRNGKIYYYQNDHLETPIRLLDEAGEVVWSAEPHGFDFVVRVNKVQQPLRFPGQYYDEETGLHYNVSRYYHPRTGRYLSPDSLLTADHSNLYLYALDNPATFTDPSGRLIPVILGAIILGGLIAANYKMWSNVAQNKPHDAGEVLEAAGKGMLVATGGVAAVALGAPVLAVGVVMMAFPAVMAAIEAPEGQAWEACQDNLPIVAAIRQAERNIDNPHAKDQLTVDLIFQGIGLAGLVVGTLAGGPKGGPPSPGLTIKMPSWQPGMTAAGPPGFGGGQVFGGQWVWQPVATVPAIASSGAAASMPMAMTMTAGGGGGGGGGEKPPDDLQKKIEKSKEAQKRADQEAEKLPKSHADKTVSSDDKKMVSGWKEAPEGYDKATPEEVAAHSKRIGHDLKPAGANDQLDKPDGFEGKYNASHAEKQQAVKNPNEPVGVTEPMCKDCREFFKKEAVHQKQDQVVTDSKVTRVFKPDGSIVEISPDGTEKVIPPDPKPGSGKK